jgi:phospholipase C
MDARPKFEAGSPVDSGSTDGGGPAPVPAKIEHVVVIVQENHTFDVYFGRYCTAAPGSNPTCNTGPTCCEAAPAMDPNGVAPTALDDKQNGAYDPNHTQACELSEMNSGAMDKYTMGASCSNAANFAIATDDVMTTYHGFAKDYALADRYFQPIVGQTSSNDMYLAVAQYQFTDNSYEPAATGHGCANPFDSTTTYTRDTVADVVLKAGHTFAAYAEGFDAMYATSTLECPAAPSDCPYSTPTLPCVYDPGDIPFEYYAQFQNNHTYMKDYADDFLQAVAGGTMPDFAYLKAVMYKNEHPGYGDAITPGVSFVSQAVNAILMSPKYKDNTLILLTWDEGGGFFDHVKPPADSTVDNQPYGTRVPMMAIGRFAKKNFVSHVQMEHSSIVKFIEWNFTGQTGQLSGRDAVVNNIGSLIDPAQTTTKVPEN